jgi:hypothetical protein|nr:MAG TPA: hypothetical protein [Caudoviricetes sp.]
MFKFKASLELYFDRKEIKDEIYEVIDDILNGDNAEKYIMEDFYKNRSVDEFEVKKEAMKRLSIIWNCTEIKFENNLDSYMTKSDVGLEIKAIVEDYVDEAVDDLSHEMNLSLRN